jgi:two-component system, cell cycle sensor histidine kinase and response regulator CckA
VNVITQFPAAYDFDRDHRFQAMFEGAAIGIGICQIDGQILEANPALSRMLGYSQRELADTHAQELYPQLRAEKVGPAADRENYSGTFLLDESMLGERWFGELMRGERSSFEIEKRYSRKDGSELWGHLTVSLGRDARGQPAYLIATLVDATERKQVEEHLREAEKMEVIGRLAGGIAHDFNNLLTGILLYCDLLLAGLKPDGTDAVNSNAKGRDRNKDSNKDKDKETKEVEEQSELCQHVEEVRMAGEQGAALTQQLLAIARKQAAEPRPIKINEIVASTENLLRRLIGEQVELVIIRDSTLDTAAGLVLADPAQLRQILLNLVLNARDAMPQGGKITLSTRTAEFPRESPDEVVREVSKNAICGTMPGSIRRAVSLTVADNGCGMNEETRARLFEPFFTTKKPGEGTGLGLATVQRIVSESGGLIEVRSDMGRGTRIEVFLPAIESAPSATAIRAAINLPSNNVPTVTAMPQPVSIQKNSKTILLVDDHAPARKSMQRILLDAGYQILAASSGKQALRLFTEHSEAPDLLIADCLMPGMNGQELAETLLRIKPGLKVLLISGYHDASLESAIGALEMIRKPFSGRALIERVVEVMDRQVS